EFHSNYLITVQSWPAFLYSSGQFDYHNLDISLFKGEILKRATVFVSPGTTEALEIDGPQGSSFRYHQGKRQTQAHVAKLLGMNTI
ncbi:hypothetical protein EV363DRAFT_1078382, partial [Boletus edulis]